MSGITLNNTDGGLVSALQQSVEFGKKHPVMAVRVVAGGIMGASMGAAAGSVLGSAVAIAVPSVAPCAPKAGAIVGGLLVGGLAVHYQITLVQESPEFWEHKGDEAKKLYDVFKERFPNENMEEYLCPISQDLIRVPVRGAACEKHQFEAGELARHMKNSKECPCCRKTLDSIVYVDDYHSKVLGKINQLTIQ